MFTASNSAVLLTGLVVVSVQTIGAIDTSMIHARALATSSSACNTEAEDCAGDSSCAVCLSEVADTAEACLAVLDSDSTCDDLDDALCCMIAAEDDCQTSSALEDFFGCFYTSCTIDLSTCTSSGATTTYISSDTLTTAADDISSSITSTSSTVCPAEMQACLSDDSCTACLVEYYEAVDGCTSGYSNSYTCDDFDEDLCCSITGGNDCADNSVLEDYFGCVFEEFCVVDFGTCTSSGAPTTTTADDGDGEDADPINILDSSAPPSVVTMTTGAALLVAVVASFNL
ncbi:unnamed protein product [Pylaiella littoralis]